MSELMPPLFFKYATSDGPLVGGKLYSYEAGTSTPKATYTDESGGTANSNPVVLDANGEASVWLSGGSYKFILTDANDVVIRTIDDVSRLGTGPAGAAFLADSGVPSSAAGVDGDSYMNTTTFDLYKKASGAWVLEAAFPVVDDTDDVQEGATNKYYTDQRVDDRIAAASVGDLSDVDLTVPPNAGQGLIWNGDDWAPGAAGGGGGGGGVEWDEGENAPLFDSIYGFPCFRFEAGLAQKLTGVLHVPSSYNLGGQINLDVYALSLDTSGTILLQSTATLINPGDELDSTTNQHASTNSAITMDSNNDHKLQEIALDLSDASGEINSVAVAKKAALKIELSRGTDTATGDIYLIFSKTEQRFS